MHTIYKCTFPNGKVYIGRTIKSLDRRKKQHLYSSRSPRTIFHKAIRSLGDKNSLRWMVLHECLEYSESLRLEISEIDAHQSTDRKFGYNQLIGGGGSPGFNWALDDAAILKSAITRFTTCAKKIKKILSIQGYERAKIMTLCDQVEAEVSLIIAEFKERSSRENDQKNRERFPSDQLSWARIERRDFLRKRREAVRRYKSKLNA